MRRSATAIAPSWGALLGCAATLAAMLSALAFAGGASAGTIGRSPVPPRHWNQWGHDAGRTGASPAQGPTWPRLVPGWPVDCDWCNAGPVVADVTIPGEPLPLRGIFTGSAYKRTVHGYGADGQPLPGNWPAVLGEMGWGGTIGFPAVAESGSETVIYAASQGDEEQWGTVYSLSADGEPRGDGWPWTAPGFQIHTFPALVEELPCDPSRPALLFAYDSYWGSFLHALGPDSQPFCDWPAPIGRPYFFQSPAVAPDGSVYQASGVITHGPPWPWELSAFTPDGRPKPGWPYRFHDHRPSRFQDDLEGFMSSAAVGSDGTVYVGMAERNYDHFGAGYVYAFTPDGRVKPGWPVRLLGVPMLTPSIAPDGTLYVSAHRTFPGSDEKADYVYALDPGGAVRPGWPLKFKSSGGLPDTGAIGGIAIDAGGNVFFGRPQRMYGYSPGAEPLPGWPLKVEEATLVVAWPALADDGTLYFYGVTSVNGQLYAVRSGVGPGSVSARRQRLANGTSIRAEPRRTSGRVQRASRLRRHLARSFLGLPLPRGVDLPFGLGRRPGDRDR